LVPVRDALRLDHAARALRAAPLTVFKYKPDLNLVVELLGLPDGRALHIEPAFDEPSGSGLSGVNSSLARGTFHRDARCR
jgi:hypothetical protein